MLHQSHLKNKLKQIVLKKCFVFFFLAFISLLLLQFIQQNILNLSYNRVFIEKGEYWRLLSGGLVHSNYYHCLINLFGLFCLINLYEYQITLRTWATVCLLLVFCVNLSIYLLLPTTSFYLGFSGALHGLYTWTSINAWKEKRSWFPLVVLLLLIVKLILDTNETNQLSAQIIGMRVHWQSHWFGLVAGIVCGICDRNNKGENIPPSHNNLQ